MLMPAIAHFVAMLRMCCVMNCILTHFRVQHCLKSSFTWYYGSIYIQTLAYSICFMPNACHMQSAELIKDFSAMACKSNH